MITIEKTPECGVCGSNLMIPYREYPTILWHNGHLDLSMCKSCGNVYPATRPTETSSIISNSVLFEAKILYKEMMVTQPSDYYYKRVVDRLIFQSTSTIRTLWDAECGTGRMLKRIRNNIHAFGSTKNIYACNLIEDAGIKVHHGYPHNMMMDGVIAPNSVDVVTMIRSLGYSYNVSGDIQSGVEALREGGLLYISLYNFSKMKDNPLGGYLNYPRRHVLMSLFTKLGVKPMFTETIDNELHLIGRKNTR